MMPDPYDISPLMMRTQNCLKNMWDFEQREGPISAFQVVQIKRDDLLRFPNFGYKSLRDIEAWLAGFGMSFEDGHQSQLEKLERAELARLKAKYEREDDA